MISISNYQPEKKAAPRVNELDLLRFFAALAVVLFHYGFRAYIAEKISAVYLPNLAIVAKYGYLGIELFFMISGFVILMSSRNATLKKFIFSRIARLYPAFWICCTLTALTTYTYGGINDSVTLHQYLANMTMFSGFYSIPSIDGAYWTLFIEMRFYILIALILAFRCMHHIERIIITWLILSIIADIFHIGGKLHTYLLFDYSPYFIAGALCYLIREDGWSYPKLIGLTASWASAIYHSLLLAQECSVNYQIEFDARIITTIVCIFFILMILIARSKSKRFLNPRWLMLGSLTYPLYLVHQKIGYIVFIKIGSSGNPAILISSTIAAMILTAYIISHHIERPSARLIKKYLNSL